MDGKRFDDLTKSVAAGRTSRRRVLGGLGSALLGGIGWAVGSGLSGDAAASHLCCTYQCGETFRTSCSRQGACPPPPVGCSVVAGSSYFVKRCKDCAVRTPQPTAIPPTQVPPTQVPPTQVPPTQVPPTQVPPTQVPPTQVPLGICTIVGTACTCVTSGASCACGSGDICPIAAPCTCS